MIWWEQLHIFVIHLIFAICRGTLMYEFVTAAITLQHTSSLCLPAWAVRSPGEVTGMVWTGMPSAWGK